MKRVIPYRAELAVYPNEGGGVTIKQDGLGETCFIAIDYELIDTVIMFLEDAKKEIADELASDEEARERIDEDEDDGYEDDRESC